MSLADIKHIEPKSVLDIGANVGNWYREAKALWPDAKFLLIEGNVNCYPSLKETGAPLILQYLSDKAGSRKLFQRSVNSTDTGDSFYKELTSFYDECLEMMVDVKTLDYILDSRLFPAMAFDLIKIDSQGSELDIIRGGLEIFKRCKHILMEVAFVPYNEGAPLAGEVLAFMDSLGFPKRQEIGDIVHPITRQVVQRDVLFSK